MAENLLVSWNWFCNRWGDSHIFMTFLRSYKLLEIERPALGANKLERDILLRVLDQVHTGDTQLVNSSVIEFENARNPFPQRKQFVEQVMKSAPMFQSYTEAAAERVKELVDACKLSLYDARHIAVAEAAQVDFFPDLRL